MQHLVSIVVLWKPPKVSTFHNLFNMPRRNCICQNIDFLYSSIWRDLTEWYFFSPTFNWSSSSYFHKRWLFPPFSYCGKIQHFRSFWLKDHILFHGLWCRENGQILNEWSNLAPKSLVVFCTFLSYYLAICTFDFS